MSGDTYQPADPECGDLAPRDHLVDLGPPDAEQVGGLLSPKQLPVLETHLLPPEPPDQRCGEAGLEPLDALVVRLDPGPGRLQAALGHDLDEAIAAALAHYFGAVAAAQDHQLDAL